MSHRFVDGTLVIARLSRSILGGALYKDVTVRSLDGRDEKLGSLMVLSGLKPVMVPGTRGRFYVYDVAGSKGVHGFRSSNGDAYAFFPLRWERLLAIIGLLNLSMAAGWLLADGVFAYWSSFFGVACSLFAIIFMNVRRASMAAFASDNVPTRDSARSHTTSARP